MSKRYWKFFLDALRYPEIQHHGPLALLAEAEGGEMDRLYDSGLMLRDQFFPARGEKESVLIHGRARGLPRHFLENDFQYRSRVVNAWAWQFLAGKDEGLKKIYAEYGFPIITLTSLSGEYHWAEYDLEVESPSGRPLSQEVFELVYWLFFEYKRATAMLRTFRLLKRAAGRILFKMVPLTAERITVYPPPPNVPVTKPKLVPAMVPIIHEHLTVKGKGEAHV